MIAIINLLIVLLPLMYGLAAVNYLVWFVRREPFAAKFSTPWMLLAVGSHALFIGLRALHFDRQPIGNIAESLSVVAFALATVYLYVEQVQRTRTTGTFILPLVFCLQLASSALLPTAEVTLPEHPLLRSTIFGVHAILAVLGHSAFALGFVYGVMHVMLYRALKAGQFGLVFERLPSLDVLSAMVFRSTFIGWLALTGTIVVGVVMSIDHFPNFYMDPKFLTTILVWTVYGSTVVAYLGLKWQGTRSVYGSLAGFIVAMVAWAGSSFIWKSFHSFLS